MDPLAVGILTLVILFVLLFLGVHIATALGTAGVIGTFLIVGLDGTYSSLATITLTKVFNFQFLVIPLFLLLGFCIDESGHTDTLFDSLILLIGRMRASLAVAVAIACTLMGTVVGTATVTCALFSKIAAPEMRRKGYDKTFSYGLVTAAGNIGSLIPPSILICVYGLTSGDSIAKLLIGGITPGLMLFFAVSLGSVVMAYRNPRLAPSIIIESTRREKLKALISFWPFVIVGIIVVGGMFSGFWSPTEAGGVGAMAMFFVFLASRRRSWAALKRALLGTISVTAMTFLIFIGGGLFARAVALTGLSTWLLDAVVGANLNPLAFLIVAAVTYIALGCVLESFSMIFITLPIFLPVVYNLGIDPIHFAMVAIFSFHVGGITPPVGVCCFATKGTSEPDVRLEDIFHGVLPYFFMMLCIQLLLIFSPTLCTFLPNLMNQ